MNQHRSFPVVDYTQHPAFVAYSPAPYNDRDAAIEKCFAKIDSRLDSAETPSRMTDDEMRCFFDEEIQKELRQVYAFCPESVTGNAELAGIVKQTLASTAKALQKDFMFWRDSQGYLPRGAWAKEGERVLADIKEQGIFTHAIPQTVIAKMNEITKGIQESLFARRGGRMDCTTILSLDSEFGDMLLAEFEKAGIIEGVSGYVGRPVEPMYCGLQLSHQDDDWWKNCYSDVGLPTSKTVYMHLDEAATVPKTVVYLNEVKLENGPFHFMKGGHLWARSATQTMFFKQLDLQLDRLSKGSDARNNPPHYYRPWMTSSNGRQYFAALPYSLRGTSHFGDDIVDESDLSQQLLAAETAFLSKDANCVTFLGGSSIHRGSQVEKGYRINLQLAWQPKPSVPNRLVRSARRLLRRLVKGRPPFVLAAK